MNSDIRLSVSWLTHPKRKRLEKCLGPKGVLSFLDLLLSVAQNKPEGILTGWSVEDISIAGNWPDNHDDFVYALLDIRLLDRDDSSGIYSIHDWKQHNPYAAHAGWRKDRARKGALARWGNEEKNKSEVSEITTEECYKHKEAMLVSQTSYAPSPAPAPAPAPKRKQNTTCPERFQKSEAAHGPPEPAALTIPIVNPKSEYPITQSDIDQWQETFPGVNVMTCLKRLRQWNIDNPTKRKTKRGIRQHISSWLAREQDKGGNGRHPPPREPFNAMEQVPSGWNRPPPHMQEILDREIAETEPPASG